MRLELVPIEGESLVSKEEQERKIKRTHPVPPEILLQFKQDEREKIKKFLVKLVVLTEQINHDMQQLKNATEVQVEQYKQAIHNINDKRQKLFQNLPGYLESFIQLLELCPMESWHEFDAMLKMIQEEAMQDYRDTKLKTGIKAALDNPFLLRTDDEIDEEYRELTKKCRVTPKEIEQLVMHCTLENLVKYMIDVRRIQTGSIWDKGFYDL